MILSQKDGLLKKIENLLQIGHKKIDSDYITMLLNIISLMYITVLICLKYVHSE